MSNLNENFETMFNKMENFVSTKTVVGEPLRLGDITLIPLVDVSWRKNIAYRNNGHSERYRTNNKR